MKLRGKWRVDVMVLYHMDFNPRKEEEDFIKIFGKITEKYGKDYTSTLIADKIGSEGMLHNYFAHQL
ncbi:MAG: hypothetical protein QXL86_00065 [Candidatus Aenigmatarchaeota archaeon]